MGKKSVDSGQLTEDSGAAPEVIGDGAGLGSLDEVILGPEAMADIAEDLEGGAEDASGKDDFEEYMASMKLERKLAKYEEYFGAALSGVVAYFGADGDQHGVLVEMAHEIAMKCLETADARRLDVLARIEAWGMMEEV